MSPEERWIKAAASVALMLYLHHIPVALNAVVIDLMVRAHLGTGASEEEVLALAMQVGEAAKNLPQEAVESTSH